MKRVSEEKLLGPHFGVCLWEVSVSGGLRSNVLYFVFSLHS